MKDFLQLDPSKAVRNMKGADPVQCESTGCGIEAPRSKLHTWGKERGFRCPMCEFLLENPNIATIVIVQRDVDIFKLGDPRTIYKQNDVTGLAKEPLRTAVLWAFTFCDPNWTYHWGGETAAPKYSGRPYPWNWS